METGPDLKNARWRKSSYSGNTGGDCVECTVTGGAAWRKSSYSGTSGGECVEVADGCHGAVPVRDSKNPAGPVLLFGAPAWRTFVDGLR
ncbi:DUF397 domain-containing protein [Streptomyces sp. A3M-1-3]|uniref:DUF397 domain-containing protein n=1 Tax=Streptomyces sp. A3M-1-3 TaxID=2962044 RepID=UPI0020B8EEC9|nr:DUF397 domain-containing protein [Streptomyces sp. A3M-1-3]MCP3821203.1 DUF397 domain-containing protein [Streptomyces sp. A3M-1-3]